MRQTIKLFLFLCLCTGSILAQNSVDHNDEKAFPGATKVRFEEKESFPKYIQFDPSQSLNVEQSLAWMRENFRLSQSTTLEFIRRNDDQLGWSHHRFQQQVNGKPVTGGVYILHEKNGIVHSMNGELFSIESSDEASISKQKAIDLALRHIPAEKYGWETTLGGGQTELLSEFPNPELVWVPESLNFKDGNFKLAYKMDVYAVRPEHRSWIYVDAQNGKIIAEEDRICHTNIEGTVQTVLSGERTIYMDQVADDTFRLRETTRGNGIVTLDLQNGPSDELENAVDFIHGDSDWGAGTPIGDRYGTDVHFGAQSYYDLLFDLFGRNSINEEGLVLRSYVHVNENWANATWDGNVARFGDGSPGSGLDIPVVSMDIVAHEFTHGLTDYTADLIYAYESGALNESFSDLFGLATDFYTRPATAGWLIGKQATADGLGIRSAEDPNFHGDPDTYKGDNWVTNTGDNGGVHSNSGVQNHWFYLLSEGGEGMNDNGEAYVVEGLGWEKAISIAYRNLSVYLTPNSSFADAAYFGNQSAADLFGLCSAEYNATVNAWHAVGLGQPVGALFVDFQAQRMHCQAPDTVQFYNYSQPFESVTWDFGDGMTSTEYSPIHIYEEEGTYDVKLIANGCGGSSDSITKPGYIVIDIDSPSCFGMIMENEGIDTLTSCAGIIMDPGGTGNYLGNANSFLVINPPTLGPLVLTFTEFWLRGDFNIPDVDHLSIYDGTSINAPLIGRFARTSLDGQTIQTSGGAVTLHFSTDIENDTTGFVMYYSIADQITSPIAAFVPSAANPLLNAPVEFIDNSQNSGHYFYDFGDGETSNEAQPTHQYTMPGSYTVTQIIRNCIGADTASILLEVQQGGTLSFAPDSICVTLNAGDQYDGAFVLSNAGPGELYYGVNGEMHPDWISFDTESGGIISGGNLSIPIHLDASNLVAATYHFGVPLESGDSSQFLGNLPVKMIVLPFPQANIGLDIEDNCNGIFQFTDLSLNDPTSWLWNFGDGNNSVETNPLYQFEENGVYDVSLIACNALGCDTILQENLVIVNYCDTLQMPVTGVDLFTNCNGIIYDDGGPDAKYSNDVDYIATIAPDNVDHVTLTVNSFQTQPLLDVLNIYDGPDTNAPLIGTFSGTVAAGTSFTSTGNTITIQFISNAALTYNGFELLWECSGELPPTANFTYEQDMECTNTVYFEDASGGNGIYSYNWDLGNGFFVYDETSFAHHYNSTGVFTVSLEVSNALATSSFEQEVTIPETPFDLDMQLSADTVDLGELVSFEAIVDFTPSSYLWVPQTGDTLITASPDYFYTEPGDYLVYLEVENGDGCRMWVQKPIHVTNITNTTEVSSNIAFQLTPNPSEGQFKLSLELSELQQTNIVLYNSIGQTLFNESLGQVKVLGMNLNLSNLPVGVYFLTLITENGLLKTKHLVIQR